jgi:predicted MFS family arabinose efflux permease
MTTASLTPTAAAPPLPRLATGPFVRLAAADFLAMCSFYVLLAVVPQYAAGLGGGSVAAGLTMGVLTCTSVAVELAMPCLSRWFDHRRLLTVGLLLLGLPSLLLPMAHGLVAILVVYALRGVGFAIVVVAVGTLVATVLPTERRGEGLGVMGVVCMLPAVGALPFGVWLAGAAGFPVAFAVAAVPATAAAGLTYGLPRPGRDDEGSLGIWAGLRHPALAGPTVLFCATAVASGVVVTFLTGAVAEPGVAVVALAAQSLATTVTRWLTGRYADRRGGAHLLAPSVLLTAAGLAVAAWTGSPVAVIGGMVALGIGFGVAQSSSMHTMLARVEPAAYGTVSAVWNLAFDLGWGVGSIVVGVLVGALGYAPAFVVTAVVVALVAARKLTRG